MKKGIFFVLVVGIISAFTIREDDPFGVKVMRNFEVRMQFRTQEKVYLHTDREYYNAGDKMWFRAYLVNAATHMPSTCSNFIYVELTDRQDSVCQRLKIVARDSLFSGYLEFPDGLPQGDYFIRAYTYWMQNLGGDYVFKKKIRILNPQDTRVITQIERKESGMVYIRFSNMKREPYQRVWIKYQMNRKDKEGRVQQQRTDESGKIRVKEDVLDGIENISVSFLDRQPFSFNRCLYVPKVKKDFQVSFFPEGGSLLAGNLQNVAFKALGSDGLSVDVDGVIYDDQDQQVCIMKSIHKGMGIFTLFVTPGKQYYAVVRTTDSIEKKVILPQPERNGIGLKTIVKENALAYTVLLADSTRLPEDLYLLVHARGVIYSISPVTSLKTKWLPLQALPDGILHMVLIDAQCRVYSQRLRFIWNNNRPEPDIFPDRTFYTNRDSVNLMLRMKAVEGRESRGTFSIAVADANGVDQDSLKGNIFSDLLLTSDLKGYIEEPAYYFQNMNTPTKYKLDLLMLTHGWTRFDVARTVRGEYDPASWYMEKGQAISGKVDNFWGKDAALAKLIMVASNGQIRMIDADSSGHFLVERISFSDGTRFILQGQSKKGKKNVEVKIDEDKFLKSRIAYPHTYYTQAQDDDFYNRYQKDYYYENGMKVYVLDEALVERHVEKKSYSFYDRIAEYSLDSAKIASMRNRDIKWIFSELPGVEVIGDKITCFSKPLYVLLNDFEEEIDRVLLTPTQDLLSVSLIRSPQSQMFFGTRAENGALIISSRANFGGSRELLSRVVFSPLGYQKYAEFYVPAYGVDTVRMLLKDSVDNRTTLYWNPGIRIGAEENTNVSFFTADGCGDYIVTLEGLLNDGTICRKRQKITVKSGE